MKKAAIFDLDGTLLNTTKDIGLAMSKAMDHEFTDEQINRFIGNGLRNAIKAAAAELGLVDPDIDALNERLHAEYRKVPVLHTVPFPGVNETLQKLLAEGKLVSVYSNKAQDLAETVMKICFPDTPFVMVVGRDGKYGNKPSSLAVDVFCERTGLSKDEVLYVGDSEVDYRTAVNSQVDYRILTWGSRPRASLLASGVPEDHLIDRMTDILPLF